MRSAQSRRGDGMMEFHSVANLFPLMSPDEYSGLVADIRLHGLREPIWLYEGKIIDGRNRYRACLEAGVAPRYRTYTGDDPYTFVISLNLHRRHLTYDQRVGLALKIRPLLKAEAEKRRNAALKQNAPHVAASERTNSSEREWSAPKAAAITHVGQTAVKQMAAVEKGKPLLAEELLAGKTTVREESKQLNRQKRIANLQAISSGNRPLDGTLGRFPVLLADPPWPYEQVRTDSRSILNHYPTMTIDAICALPVQEVTTDTCVLFLWVTSPMVVNAARVLEAWGFSYRTCMAWVKDKVGMGHWVRQRHELLFIATKGAMVTPPEAARPDSVIEAPRRGHSEKPEEVYELIERMYPELSKLELFARTQRLGWSTWGNQVPCGAGLDEIDELEVAA